MYFIAADNNLENGSLFKMIDELQTASLNPHVNLVVFIDEKKASPRYVYFRPSGGPDVTFLDEPNTGDPQTLRNFINHARTKYPADHYVLTIADHGHGISGVAIDEGAKWGPWGADWLTLAELRSALEGGPHFDVIFMNACLMATMDASLELQTYADYYVASQAVIWLYDPAYYVDGGNIIPPIVPEMGARELALNIANSHYQALKSEPGSLSQHPGTISVMDLKRAGGAAQSASALAAALRQSMVENALVMRSTFEDVQRFDEGRLLWDRFVDLYDFADKLASRSSTPQVRIAAEDVKAAITAFVIHNILWNGYYDIVYRDYDNSHGVSVVFPGTPKRLCYYSAEWLEFAGNANWNCQRLNNSSEPAVDASPYTWGDMLAAYVETIDPNAEEIWNPPAPVAPLIPAYDVYLPTVLVAASGRPVTGPTATPTLPPTLPPTQTPAPTATPVPSEGMIFIPPGPFQMGCDSSNPIEEGCTKPWQTDEVPLHTIYLDAFYIDKYEVTNARYQACVTVGGCTAPAKTASQTRAAYYGNPVFADYPVIWVTWEQAKAFCAWEGKRLPTEAEWERVARGSSDTRKYPWGNSVADCSRLNMASPSGMCVGDTNRVGSYPSGAGPSSVMDMSGNVWEWVSDWFDANYYQVSPSANPQGPASSSLRSMRGGSWSNDYQDNRIANRHTGSPGNNFYDVGFRCVKPQ